jgi:ribosomal protein S18 acetylase RimI-like enzyme
METTSRFLTSDDAPVLLELYQTIADKTGGFVRTRDELTLDYAQKVIGRVLDGGVGICALDNSKRMVGAITAHKFGLKVFDHVLSGITVGVHPTLQSKGIGRRLFLDFIEHVQNSRTEILRVELMARDSNSRQIAFYEAIGFRREGTFEKRIRNLNGDFESDIAMAWLKPEDMTV